MTNEHIFSFYFALSSLSEAFANDVGFNSRQMPNSYGTVAVILSEVAFAKILALSYPDGKIS